ncbi:MAG: hypothetical protein UIL37_05305 [Clostridia bacterium]|nr:hypothetical protein [Clostridia bacterium]
MIDLLLGLKKTGSRHRNNIRIRACLESQGQRSATLKANREPL